MNTPGGTQKSFIRGGSAPKSNPLSFYIPFFSEKAPLLYTFYWKKAPLSYTIFMNKSLKQQIFLSFFHTVHNKLKWNSHKVCLLDLFALFNTWMKIFLPFHKLVKSLPVPFYIPEAWKRYPFRAETPCVGHYREVPPRDEHTTKKTCLLSHPIFSSVFQAQTGRGRRKEQIFEKNKLIVYEGIV